MKHYVVLDFEMCKVPYAKRKSFGRSQEIIQIGAVLMNEQFEIVGDFMRFVKPQFGVLDSFISGLTGISRTQVASAGTFPQMVEEFAAWLPEGNVELVAWSGSDKSQLMGEMHGKQVSNARLEALADCWTDSQKLYAEKLQSRRDYALSEALIACDIPSTGREHDGLVDARNTALLFKKLMTEEKLVMNTLYASAREEEEEHLSCSLGELFAGLGMPGCAVAM